MRRRESVAAFFVFFAGVYGGEGDRNRDRNRKQVAAWGVAGRGCVSSRDTP